MLRLGFYPAVSFTFRYLYYHLYDLSGNRLNIIINYTTNYTQKGIFIKITCVIKAIKKTIRHSVLAAGN